jgi:proline dehydrogenase
MPEPSVLGVLASIIAALVVLAGWLVRLYVREARRQVAEANARADRFEQMAMRALGATEQILPVLERRARVAETVEDVVGHSMLTSPTEGDR